MNVYPFVLIGIVLVILAVPSLIWEASVKQFARGLLVSVFAVVLPLFTFFLSAGLVPDWKGGCPHGWIDCFHEGKIALMPIVLWATAALYVTVLSRLALPYPRWIGLGLFSGATVAGGCFLYGVFAVGSRLDMMLLWLLVPLYVTVWYAVRSGLLKDPSKLKSVPHALAFCSSVPFWIGGLFWSRRIYESLPDQAPSCFVVTAASRGHRQFVGPFVSINRHGRKVSANRQLLNFWQLEESWRARAPRSHAAFRRAYNRLGPLVARRINSPWIADAAYVALKPIEWPARLLVSLSTCRRDFRAVPPSIVPVA